MMESRNIHCFLCRNNEARRYLGRWVKVCGQDEDRLPSPGSIWWRKNSRKDKLLVRFTKLPTVFQVDSGRSYRVTILARTRDKLYPFGFPNFNLDKAERVSGKNAIISGSSRFESAPIKAWRNTSSTCQATRDAITKSRGSCHYQCQKCNLLV